MRKRVIFSDEAKDQILEGAEILYKAVSTTLGPKGQNAVIEAYGEPIVTHDGVTVAKSIELGKEYKSRPGVRIGVEMIKSSSSKTNDNVGDGTTSSTILAYHLIDGGRALERESSVNPMILRRELEKAKEEVLQELEILAEPVKTEKQAIEIATISSENDEIGTEVGKMYHRLGKNAMVTVELDQSLSKTEYRIVEGYTFDRGVFSPLFIRDHRTQTTTLENPAVFIARQHLSFKDVDRLIAETFNAGKESLIIIADDFKQDIVETALRANLQILLVKAPGFGEARPLLMTDIAKLCGTRVFGKGFPEKVSEVKFEDLGTCTKIVSTNNETVLTGTIDVSDHIKDLDSKLKTTKGELDKQKLEKRIAQLRAKVGEIHVGGQAQMEAEERKYLIDDAVAATEAAIKEGIVPGGGTTYVELSRRLKDDTEGAQLLKDALLWPFKVLMENAGERYGVKLEQLKEYGKGFDVLGDGSLVDLKEHGVIDPVLVIKQAIKNAVSVAGSALTCGVLIVNEEIEEKNDTDE